MCPSGFRSRVGSVFRVSLRVVLSLHLLALGKHNRTIGRLSVGRRQKERKARGDKVGEQWEWKKKKKIGKKEKRKGPNPAIKSDQENERK